MNALLTNLHCCMCMQAAITSATPDLHISKMNDAAEGVAVSPEVTVQWPTGKIH